MIAGRDWLGPMMAAALVVVVLPLWVWVLSKINHGAGRRPRRDRSRNSARSRSSSRPQGYNADAARCRTLRSDDAADRSQPPAHRLVDRRGLRRIPRDRPEYLGGVRLSGSGTPAGTDVRTFAGMAARDRQGMGSRPTSPRPVAVDPQLTPNALYNTGAVKSAV
jgi:hypothetical protein